MTNPILRRFVLKTLAVDPAFGGNGIGSWLTAEAHAKAEELGFTGGGIPRVYVEWLSLSEHFKDSGRTIREYVLFEKEV